MYYNIKECSFNIGNDSFGDKEINYVLISMEAPKATRYFIRGGYADEDYEKQLKEEVAKEYPHLKEDNCKYTIRGGGKIKKVDKKVFMVYGTSERYGEGIHSIAAIKLKYDKRLKGMNFIAKQEPKKDKKK